MYWRNRKITRQYGNTKVLLHLEQPEHRLLWFAILRALDDYNKRSDWWHLNARMFLFGGSEKIEDGEPLEMGSLQWMASLISDYPNDLMALIRRKALSYEKGTPGKYYQIRRACSGRCKKAALL